MSANEPAVLPAAEYEAITDTVTDRRPPPVAPPRGRVDRAYYWMIIPVLFFFGFFITLPALIGAFFSFTNFAGYGDWEFIGINNYLNIFQDPTVLQPYLFTFFLAIVCTITVNIVGMAVALGLNAKIKWRTGIRGIFFIPMVMSALIVAYVFNFLFSTSLPTIAENLGITPLATSILANEQWAWLAIVIVTVWQAAPGTIIIYLAGLQAIPTDIYEAGSLDGASAWRQFRSLTLPLMVGYLFINIILGFKGFLGAYEIIVALTGGGPGTATISVAMKIFSGFTGGDYAYQMANAVIYFLITLIISLTQLRIIQRRGVAL